MRQILTEPTFN